VISDNDLPNPLYGSPNAKPDKPSVLIAFRREISLILFTKESLG